MKKRGGGREYIASRVEVKQGRERLKLEAAKISLGT